MKPRLSSARKTLKAWKKKKSMQQRISLQESKTKKVFRPLPTKKEQKSWNEFPPEVTQVWRHRLKFTNLSQTRTIQAEASPCSCSCCCLWKKTVLSCCFNLKRNLFLPQKATKETKTRGFVLLVVAAAVVVVVVAVVAPKQKCLKRRFCGLFVFRQKPSLKRSFFGSFSIFLFFCLKLKV